MNAKEKMGGGLNFRELWNSYVINNNVIKYNTINVFNIINNINSILIIIC